MCVPRVTPDPRTSNTREEIAKTPPPALRTSVSEGDVRVPDAGKRGVRGRGPGPRVGASSPRAAPTPHSHTRSSCSVWTLMRSERDESRAERESRPSPPPSPSPTQRSRSVAGGGGGSIGGPLRSDGRRSRSFAAMRRSGAPGSALARARTTPLVATASGSGSSRSSIRTWTENRARVPKRQP